MTEYNAERIVQARHLEGMTQRELSERSHISQSKLSKLQNGFIVFKENEARAIAAALGFPMAYFTREDPILPMTAVTYRKTSKSSMGELAAVSIEYSELCARCRDWPWSSGHACRQTRMDPGHRPAQDRPFRFRNRFHRQSGEDMHGTGPHRPGRKSDP